MPKPISAGSPYIPVITYTIAWPTVIIIPKSFWAPLNRALSFGVSPTSIILAPANSCMIRPEVTIGEMPNSMRVPLFEARITRIQCLQPILFLLIGIYCPLFNTSKKFI
ncbi:hypothetical protein BpHYR1_015557 [Brachionus plicatilis]|uniref:Uncharacterized protein n=1 Tax=Brachionus plicatilis TaxID=10195 RepID=A0A3M7S5E1_BRAPC|nr:hypothetical protein BpHYR1_015557 [Brachionus plicatilis]